MPHGTCRHQRAQDPIDRSSVRGFAAGRIRNRGQIAISVAQHRRRGNNGPYFAALQNRGGGLWLIRSFDSIFFLCIFTSTRAGADYSEFRRHGPENGPIPAARRPVRSGRPIDHRIGRTLCGVLNAFAGPRGCRQAGRKERAWQGRLLPTARADYRDPGRGRAMFKGKGLTRASCCRQPRVPTTARTSRHLIG